MAVWVQKGLAVYHLHATHSDDDRKAIACRIAKEFIITYIISLF